MISYDIINDIILWYHMMSLLWTPLHNLETSLVQNPAPALWLVGTLYCHIPSICLPGQVSKNRTNPSEWRDLVTLCDILIWAAFHIRSFRLKANTGLAKTPASTPRLILPEPLLSFLCLFFSCFLSALQQAHNCRAALCVIIHIRHVSSVSELAPIQLKSVLFV